MPFFSENESENDFVIDFQQIPDAENVPDGVHNALVTGWKKGKNRTGKPYVRFSFQLTDGENAGRVLSHFIYWTEAAAPHSKRFCVNLGIDPNRTAGDYPPLYVEIKTQTRDARDGRRYAEIASTRRVDPPAETGGGNVPGAL